MKVIKLEDELEAKINDLISDLSLLIKDGTNYKICKKIISDISKSIANLR